MQLESISLRCPHVFEMIFEKLDDQTLVSCRLVSRTLYNLIDKSKIIWTRIIHKYIGKPQFELKIQRAYQSRYHTPMLVILRLMEIQSGFRLVLLVCPKIKDIISDIKQCGFLRGEFFFNKNVFYSPINKQNK